MIPKPVDVAKLLESVLKKLEERGIKPDAQCFNEVLYRQLHDHDDLEAAELTLKTMRSHGLEPDLITYNIFISHFGFTNGAEQATQVLAVMEKTVSHTLYYLFGSFIFFLSETLTLTESFRNPPYNNQCLGIISNSYFLFLKFIFAIGNQAGPSFLLPNLIHVCTKRKRGRNSTRARAYDPSQSSVVELPI
jgi:hypothetical protein